MGARLRMFLTREQDKTLLKLRTELESVRHIKLSPDRLRRVLKKRGSYGVSRVTPITNEVSKNVSNKPYVVVVD
jgi:transposase